MFKNRRISIISGGIIGPWILEEIENEDFLIGVDKGAVFLIDNNIRVDYALGDFDSVNLEELAKIRTLCEKVNCYDPVDKDYTDTEIAFNWALMQKPAEILLFGVTGGRLDHTLANIHLLARGLERGITCRIIDEKNDISLINKTTLIKNDKGKYISLLPFAEEVTGITLEGFEYPLVEATLKVGESRGISNILKSDCGRISLTSGRLLVIKSED